MRQKRFCRFCEEELSPSRDHCVACGRELRFLNVEAAEDDREALEKRFQAERARYQYSEQLLQRIVDLVSTARVVACHDSDTIDAVIKYKFDVLPTHLQLEKAEFRDFRHSDRYEPLRRKASEEWFPDYGDDIHFAALSIDGSGVPKYGSFTYELKGRMVQHRASLLPEDSVKLLERILSSAPQSPMPEGHRAVWDDRAKLAFTKIAARYGDAEEFGDVAKLLLDGPAEEYLEVHVYGPLSIKSMERITGPASEITRRQRTTIQETYPDIELVLLDD